MYPERKVVVVDMADTTPGPAERRVVRGDLTVTKTPGPGADPAPRMTLAVSSEYDVPVAVRVVEPVPDDADPDRICVPAADADRWTLADDGLAWSGHVPPNGEAEAVYGVLPADADHARAVLGAPVVDAVHPAADASDGGPQWRTTDAAAPERTMADVASEESPAALAAAEATMRAAMDAVAAGSADATGDETTPTADGGVRHDTSGVDRAETAGFDATDGFDAADGTHLRVEFAADATTTARERALRSFARTADVTGCEPGIGRVASGRADAVRLQVESETVADALDDHDAVRRVAEVTPDRSSAERTFRELQRDHDPVPPAELQRALDEATADGGPMDEETVGLGELLAEHGEDAGQTGATGVPAAVDDASGDAAPGDASREDAASGGRDTPDTDASDTDASDASDPDASDTPAPNPDADADGAPLVDALAVAVADASDDQVAALRAALDLPERGRADARLETLTARVERLEDAVEALDDAGEATDVPADLHERTRAVERAVASLTDEAGEARLDRSVLESDLDQIAEVVEDLRERVAAVERSEDRLYGG